MRIAVNTRLLLKDKLEGIGWFSYETLKRITKNHPEHQFYFIFDRPFSEEFVFGDNVIPSYTYPQARHPYLWYLFFEYGIPYQLHKIKPDLFLSTDGWIPLHLNIPVVNVIHDLNFERHPEFIDKVPLIYYQKYFQQFAQCSTRLATVSEYSKSDIIRYYNIPEEKIDVVYNGCNQIYKPLTKAESQAVRDQLTQGKPYFLFVGLVHKRKNLDRILKAFDIYKKEDTQNMQLVVVGDKKYCNREVVVAYENMHYKEDVHFMGRVGANQLANITGSSTALLYPSLYEGFGIPIVEGFHAEIPVLTSNLSAMPEVAGNAAYFVDPYSEMQIAKGLKILSEDTSLREMLIKAGRIQRERFSWDLTAVKLWNTIEKTMK